jgi:hypothetical protein
LVPYPESSDVNKREHKFSRILDSQFSIRIELWKISVVRPNGEAHAWAINVSAIFSR